MIRLFNKYYSMIIKGSMFFLYIQVHNYVFDPLSLWDCCYQPSNNKKGPSLKDKQFKTWVVETKKLKRQTHQKFNAFLRPDMKKFKEICFTCKMISVFQRLFMWVLNVRHENILHHQHMLFQKTLQVLVLLCFQDMGKMTPKQ